MFSFIFFFKIKVPVKHFYSIYYEIVTQASVYPH